MHNLCIDIGGLAEAVSSATPDWGCVVDDESKFNGLLFARGLLETHENILGRGMCVRQNDTMPQQLRRALEWITHTYVMEG